MGIGSLPFNCRDLCCIDLLWNDILVNTVFIKPCSYPFYELIRNYPNDYWDSWYAIYGRRHALGWLVWCTTTNFLYNIWRQRNSAKLGTVYDVVGDRWNFINYRCNTYGLYHLPSHVSGA